MPRLNKIRITGNKYDGFQKQHRDSIFDLAADHTLFTLQNGSGKGVMLQLISQIMLPGTSWGRNNGNKVEGMFYDRYDVFRPYTFHVVLEWLLDNQEQEMNSDREKLLAGICVSAHRKKSLDEDEGKVGLKYFLYTHKYRGHSSYSLENLPLYSETGGGVLDYEDMEDFVEEKSRDLRRYSKSSVASLNSPFYQFMASHGIYRSEWEIMKAINRSEGGLEKYFSRARDNQALFDKLIIPAVSESISSRSEENENSLLNMFVDNIKIAENLPELISRTEDIKELQQMIKPLLVDAEHGSKLEKSRAMVRERGNNYLQALQSRLNFLHNELQRSKRNRQETETRIKELEFEEQNLKYARKVRELQDLKQKREGFEEKIADLQEEIEELIARKKRLKLNRLHLVYQKCRREYRQKKERIGELKSASELTDLRQEINRVQEEIEKAWPELKRMWKRSSREADAYLTYLQEEEKRLQEREQNLKRQIRELERKIDRYENRKKELEEWKQKLSDRFNPLQLSTPSYLLKLLADDLEEKEDKLVEMEDSRAEKDEEITAVREEIESEKIKLARVESNYQSLDDVHRAREQQENELAGKIIDLLDLDKYREVYSQDWLEDREQELKKLLVEKRESRQELNNKFYELQQDLTLNEGEHWIANYDQQRLYRLIGQLDIKVYYGSDFLLNLSKNPEELLQEHPLLPYGLVLMYENDWQRVKKNLQEEDLFRAPVPVFINRQLDEKEEAPSYRLVHGREEEFISAPDTFQKWYQSLEQRSREIKKSVDILDRKIKNIRQLIFSARELKQKSSSAELAAEMEEFTEEINTTREKIDKSGRRLDHLQEDKMDLERKIEKRKENCRSLKADMKEIEKFAAEVEYLETKKAKIEKTGKQLTDLEEKLEDTAVAQKENTRLRFKLENDLQNWRQDRERFLAELKEIISGLEFSERGSESPQQNYPQLFDYRDSRVNSLYQKLGDLEKREEEKALEIKYLRREMDDLRERLLTQEKKMVALDSEWKSYSFAGTNDRELESKLEIVGDKLSGLRQKLDQCEGKRDVLSGEINAGVKEVDKLYGEIERDFSRAPRKWEQLDLEQKELEISNSLAENREYVRKLSAMIEEYNEKSAEFENLINRLDYYQLTAEKGEINSRLEEEVRNNPREMVEDWVQDYREIERKLQDLKQKTEDDFYQFKGNVNELVDNKILRTRIRERIIQGFRSDRYTHNREMLSTFREYLHNELNRLDEDKSRAERARNQWAERSAMHIIRIITSLQEMINNMVYHNQRGYAFPLVRLRRKDLLPESEEDIIPELKEYFVEVIAEFQEQEIDVDRLTDGQLREYTGDAALFSRAIRGRYPVLQVYKMTEKNEFQYARPEDYYYADWESVIQGKSGTREGSGGQSLSINAFMMMMLLNYKKQRLDQTNPWTVLFLDNPFGKASAAHVLDPVFKIADKLNFQLVALAAPEIIKTEISERFPVFWALEINDDTVEGQVVYGERVRKNKSSV